jgi:hypothetical protein
MLIAVVDRSQKNSVLGRRDILTEKKIPMAEFPPRPIRLVHMRDGDVFSAARHVIRPDQRDGHAHRRAAPIIGDRALCQ